MCFSRSENCNKRELGNAACYRGVNAARSSLRELDTEADRDEERRARLRPSSLWPGARPDPTQGDGEERVRGGGGHTSGANISLAGSPGHGGGQGSAGEGEAACPAVN